MAYRPVTHVLFDMDGLILNTEDLYTEAFQNIVSKYGKEYTYNLKITLMGTQAAECAALIVKQLELPITAYEFLDEAKKQYEVLFPDAKLLPGAKKLIEHLSKHNIPIALATSSTEESYELKTSKHHKELFSLFPIKVFGSSDPDVEEGKPSPDIFLVTARRFPDKPDPEKCLVFEDSVNGMRAGLAAGMQVVMVPDLRLPKVLTVPATLAIDSLEYFEPELFGLPPYEDYRPPIIKMNRFPFSDETE